MNLLSLSLTFTYKDVRTAETILSSVSPENGGYVSAELDGTSIHYTMSAENAGTLRNTADDLLACIKAAEDAAGIVSERIAEEEEQ